MVAYEVRVTIKVDVCSPPGGVSGRLESRYGRQSFSGWLELLGTLETLVDRARDDAGRAEDETIH
jgi:hypothetical protein